MARAWHRDGRAVFKSGQRARYCFDRQSEIIGDVLARHRKFELVDGLVALGHFEQEARDALLRGFYEQQDVLLHSLQLAAGHGPELAGDIMIACGKRLNRAALNDNDFYLRNSFGGERVLAANLVPEEVTGEINAPICRRPSFKIFEVRTVPLTSL